MSDDWNTVTVIGNKRNQVGGSNVKNERAVNIARRQGMAVNTESKYGAAQNTQRGTSMNTLKLDQETEELKHKTLDLSVGKLIQQGRQNKGWTQKELATKVCEKPQVITEYEQGKAIPNQNILGKIERAIGIKLRGKDKGAPLESGPKKGSKK